MRICGEVSANPLFAILLVGMGFVQLSMNAYSIPVIRRILGALDLETARTLAAEALRLDTAQAVADYLVDEVSRRLRMDLSASAWEIGSAVAEADPAEDQGQQQEPAVLKSFGHESGAREPSRNTRTTRNEHETGA